MDEAGAHPEILIAGLLVAVSALVPVARRLGVPFPVFLVVAGLAIPAIPGVPHVDLDPDLVLLIFLPPLLYYAAFITPLREFRADIRAIGMLAVGLVLATCFIVAVVAHELVDGMPWAAAFVLGAIVSPTDPVAATAIAGRLGVPRRVVTIVEGESLINDATALVAYKVAVVAVTSGAFSAPEAVGSFVGGAAGGVAIGLAVGVVVAFVRRRLDDPPVEITISLLTAYVAYLPAEALGLSGVVAAVTVGLYMGVQTPNVTSAIVRMQTGPVWEILVFVLNSVLFLLIGLQLPRILDATEQRAGDIVLYGLVISVTVVLVRLAWVYVVSKLSAVLDRLLPPRRPLPRLRDGAIIGWMGMRGAVSLAAALALPLTTDAGDPFPYRGVILGIVFAVILFTLVVQGLTLPALVRRLGIAPDDDTEDEAEARRHAAAVALERLDALSREEWTSEDSIERLRGLYSYRQARFASRLRDDDDGRYEDMTDAWMRMQCSLISAQRDAIEALRREGRVADEVARKVTYELDLEEARIRT